MHFSENKVILHIFTSMYISIPYYITKIHVKVGDLKYKQQNVLNVSKIKVFIMQNGPCQC